jgi:hypothetical protein
MGSLTELLSLLLQISVLFLKRSDQILKLIDFSDLICVLSLHIFKLFFELFELHILFL